LAFGLLFVPLTAPVSTPYSLGRQVREAVTAPARMWRRRSSAGPADELANLASRVAEAAIAPVAPAAQRMIDDAPRSPSLAVSSELTEDRPRFLSRR
jgi:hypothetical protein